MNKRLLRSIMVLNGDTNESLAKALNMSPQRLSAKINETNGAQFVQSEISAIRSKYALTDEQLTSLFFADNVS